MNSLRNSSLRTRVLLAAALGFAAMAAHAKSGVVVQPTDEAKVQTGMTQAQVEATIGHPEQAQHYKLSNTSTWTYLEPGPTNKLFQVDFDGQGRVTGSNTVDESY